VKVWNMAGPVSKELYTLKGHSGHVNSVAVDNNKNLIFSASADKSIKVWNLTTGALIRTMTNGSDAMDSLAINKYGQVISGSDDKLIRVWDAERGEVTDIYKSHTDAVDALVCDAEGHLFSGSDDKKAKRWDLPQVTFINV
jgi:WD40 repeat protein